MVANSMREGTGFVVVLIKEGQEAGGPATYHRIGTYCEIIDFDQQDNGLLSITLQGKYRVSIEDSEVQADGLNIASIIELPALDDSIRTDDDDKLLSIINGIVNMLDKPYNELKPSQHSPLWQICRLLEWTRLDLDTMYSLIEMNSAEELMVAGLEALHLDLANADL